MFRRNLIPLLLDRDRSVAEIAREVGEPVKDVLDDVRHLLKSLKHSEYEVEIIPAECRRCEFEFDADKLTKPSKCPKCKGTWIYEPRILLRHKAEAV